MRKNRQIKVVSFAVFQAVLMSLVGFIAGILYSFCGLIYDLFTTGLSTGTALALLSIIGMPIMFATFGFILGIVEAILYNLFASWFGGINMDFVST